MYLIPPMEEEPPAAYVSFVTTRLGELRREADRLVGGDPEGTHLYMDALADVAGHWRRLCWLSRLRHRDAPADYLHRRLAARTRRWRDEQVHEVDIRVLDPSAFLPARPSASLALRKAAVLPDTARSGVGALADAEIAWVQAYRRQQWHSVGRIAVAIVLIFGAVVQYLNSVSTPG